jgi:Domain of unknown function (DUF4304)
MSPTSGTSRSTQVCLQLRAVAKRPHHSRRLLRLVWLLMTCLSAPAALEADETEPNMDLTPFVKLLDPLLTERGYERVGPGWYRRHEDSVLKIDLQPAKYAPGPYVNLSVSYRRYGTATEFADLKFQVTTRLQSLVPDPAYLVEITDLGSDIPAEEREASLRHLILTYGLPWLEGLVKLENARAFLAQGTSQAVFVVPEARGDLRP